MPGTGTGYRFSYLADYQVSVPLATTSMSSLYLHIPFCRQACNYCNFHFTTSLHFKPELVSALLMEAGLQKDFLAGETLETIYFGGGTPSLLEISDMEKLLGGIRRNYPVEDGAEITLEANPDDISAEKLDAWENLGINRLSIGIQSFHEDDLRWMNRTHSARQSEKSLDLARERFSNITIDLIYGIPGLTHEKWRSNVERALRFQVDHLSCYALTVEPKTPLDKLIREKKFANVDAGHQSEQFLSLMQWMEDAGYEHYEISNFSKPGFGSRHNTSYWTGKKYLGLGPSAHSYAGEARQWNVSNNNQYVRSIMEGKVPFEREILTPAQKMNEYIMTSLRTSEGIDMQKLEKAERERLGKAVRKFIDRGMVIEKEGHLRLTREGKLFADGIAAELFF
jgi:oxygen-independent coproporphyrinogen-3 oxidase